MYLVSIFVRKYQFGLLFFKSLIEFKIDIHENINFREWW